MASDVMNFSKQVLYSLLKIYNSLHFLKRMLQVVDNAVFWQNVLLYFETDPLSQSFFFIFSFFFSSFLYLNIAPY